MARITMEEYEDRPSLPGDSIVLLKVQEIGVREIKSTRDNSSWQKLEWKFKILDIQAVGDGSPKEYYEALIGTSLYGSTPFRLNNGAENKLKNWAEAVLGMEMPIGFDLDTDLLENKQVRGITGTYDKRTNDPKTGLPAKGMNIDSLLPIGGSVLNQAAPAAASPWDKAQTLQPLPPTQGNPQPAMASGWGEEPPF